MNWINTKDKLPDEDVWILFSDIETGYVDMGIMHDGNFCLPQYDYIRKHVTHWQDMPDPPNKISLIKMGIDELD